MMGQGRRGSHSHPSPWEAVEGKTGRTCFQDIHSHVATYLDRKSSTHRLYEPGTRRPARFGERGHKLNMEGHFVHFQATLTATLLLLVMIFLTVFCLSCRRRRTNQAQPKHIELGVQNVPLLPSDNDRTHSLSSQRDSDDEIQVDSDLEISISQDQSSPLKPGKPRAVRVTFDSVELEWTKPEQSAHNVTSYTICYRSAADPPHQWTEQDAALMVTSGDRTLERVFVTQLVEKKTYYFKVRPAANGLESDISEPIKTKGMIPSQPGKPQCSNISHDSIQLEWTKPEQGAHNIIVYRILYRSHNDPPDKWMEQKVESTKEMTTVSQLLEGTVYSFKVQPECEDGFGLESGISEPITTKTITPCKPGKPIATKVTHDSIQLVWTKPEQGAHNITSYSIYYQSTADPSHQWSRTEQDAAVTVTADNETMLITQLVEKTTYHFKVRPECTAGNGVESDTSEPIKTKGIIPSQPGKPQCSSVSHDTIQLEWTKPEQGAHNIIAYRVFYRSHNDPPDKWIDHIKIAEEKVTVSQLLEKTIYSFKVWPECEDGVGLESDVSDPIQTKMVIPSKLGKPIATNVTYDSIQLEWNKPEEGAHNVIAYHIFYHSHNDPPDKWIEQKVESAEEMVTVSQLLEGTIYSFKVQPKCEDGFGVVSDISKPITTKTIIPSKPGKPIATKVTHDSIQLEWTKPEQGTHNIIAYRVLYRFHPRNDPPDKWIEQKVESAEEMVTVSQLSERTIYSFKVQMESEEGVGLESVVSDFIQTKMIIPSKPGKPKASNITYNNIQLEWTKPEEGAHNITSYTVFYRSTSDPPDTWTEHKAVTNEEVILPQLSENMVYYFKIRSECEASAGLESDISDPIKTNMIIPSKPGKPKASNITHNSIQLEWIKPKEGAHNITSYTVLYHSTSDPPDTWSEHEAVTNEEALLPQLSENMMYCFKIRSECDTGVRLESDISDPIQTKIMIPSKPGKPKASSVSYNSIQLEWTKPEEGAHNITSYVIFYRCASDPPDQWILSKSGTSEGKFTVSHLSENTIYSFRIQPEYEGGVGTESDVSESIKTKGLPLSVVIKKMWDARRKWYFIGLCLGVDTTDLDVIENNYQQDIDSCFRKMLSKWLNQVNGTWQLLIDALRDQTVGCHCLADSIEAEFLSRASVPRCGGEGFECPCCGTCSFEKYLNRKCPKLLSLSNSAFPFLDTSKLTKNEKLKLHMKLIKETENINDDFDDLLDQVKESFDDMPTKELQKVAYFVKDRLLISSPLLDINSASAIVQCLKKKTSFFNYHNVQRVIAKFGTDKDREKLSVYETSFKNFCERSIFEVPEAIFGPPPVDGQMLVFKVTDQIINSFPHNCDSGLPVDHHTVIKSANTLQISLNDALKVIMKIAEVLDMDNVGCLEFLGASKGCIELKLSAPNAILNEVLQLHGVKILTELPGFADLEAANIHILCGPPGKPYAINVTSNSINLQWSRLECQGFHRIQHYCIHYKSLRDPLAKWRTVQSKAFVENLEVEGLPQNGTPFVFKVQAVNAIGAGVPSEKSDPIDLIVMRPPLIEISGDFPSKPGKPQALTITHDSIKLEWTKPERGVESIITYTILYRAQFNDPPNQWMEKRSVNTEERVVVSQLLENTIYLFQVQPECDAGIGLESDVSDPIKTGMKIPSKPGKPRALNVTHDSIQLEWTKPEEGAHNIIAYHVIYRSHNDDPPDKWTEQKVKSAKEMTTVSQLLERTSYSFKVQPECEDGFGLESDISEAITTKMIIPSKPGKPIANSVSHDSIQIGWTKPEQGAHNITSYTIFYRSASDPSDFWMQQKVKPVEEKSTLSELSQNTVYFFRVRSECGDSFGSDLSDVSAPIKTKKMIPSTQITDGASTVSCTARLSAGP